jgi:cytidyltransferase-like protein
MAEMDAHRPARASHSRIARRRNRADVQVPVAVVHGRFQPLHLGHLEYLLAAKALCKTLVVGITNPDPWLVRAESTDTERGTPHANPCTYYERHVMIEGALVDAGVPRKHLRLVPFPHSFPERLRYYAPPDALYVLTIYDAWGEAKLARFAGLGLQTHVMWRRRHKITSGSKLRELIATGGLWQRWVPPATARVIRDFEIDRRIQAAAGMSEAGATAPAGFPEATPAMPGTVRESGS